MPDFQPAITDTAVYELSGKELAAAEAKGRKAMRKK